MYGTGKGVAKNLLADAFAGIAKSGAHVLGRNASATPGGIATRIDPRFIKRKASLIADGHVIVVCGTNGKTTVTNMLATVARNREDVAEVSCNAEGANMVTGVATALVGARHPDWGIFEVDELATRLVLPDLRPDIFVLLNLFRDQMDRSGEIDHTQDVLVESLSPLAGHTTLVANADDPLVADVGLRYAEVGGRVVWFGIGTGIRTRESTVNEARLCPRCGHPLSYSYQTYAMMGHYSCPNGDFRRPALDYKIDVTKTDSDSCSVMVSDKSDANHLLGSCSVGLGGTYMAYNMSAVSVATYVSDMARLPDVTESLASFHPRNGRLQRMEVDGHAVMLNLAKNPTGFNQNIEMVCDDDRQKVVCVSINDGVQDGHDISWIWDIDFELLRRSNVTKVFAMGTRRGDIAIRMRYAGIEAQRVDGMAEVFAGIPHDGDEQGKDGNPDICVLCNYTALWPAKAQLEKMERHGRSLRRGSSRMQATDKAGEMTA